MVLLWSENFWLLQILRNCTGNQKPGSSRGPSTKYPLSHLNITLLQALTIYCVSVVLFIYICKNLWSFIKGPCCIKIMNLHFYGDLAKFFICCFLIMNAEQFLMFSLVLLFGFCVLW